jgi:hypothetical protein
MVNASRHKTDAPTIPLVGNIGDLHFQAIAKRTRGDIKVSDTKFVPNIFFNLRPHQIGSAVSLSREAQSQGA